MGVGRGAHSTHEQGGVSSTQPLPVAGPGTSPSSFEIDRCRDSSGSKVIWHRFSVQAEGSGPMSTSRPVRISVFLWNAKKVSTFGFWFGIGSEKIFLMRWGPGGNAADELG